jgi:hypothetical protein
VIATLAVIAAWLASLTPSTNELFAGLKKLFLSSRYHLGDLILFVVCKDSGTSKENLFLSAFPKGELT